ncbi:MAG TPA: hypothetical protein VG916_14320 [Gemmatimonadaceae bacterium]|nr:hypothetical protein [Gemmatimonadaceae bacterium]
MTRPKAPRNRHLQFVLRDGSTIDGTIKAGRDQSLVSFLNSRSGWMNVTDAVRVGSGEAPGHMIVQTEHVVMVISLDGDVGVSTSASGAGERMVEIALVGGRMVRGYMPAAAGQRLSDTVARAGRYIGVTLARLFPEGTDVGDIAIQTAALAIVRDLSGLPQETEE